ncbi:threonine synthase [Thermocladium modestius]|nr:threonine synthase [Thermocladium modestius]
MKCPRCGAEVTPSPTAFKCPRCGELLDAMLESPVLNPSGRGVWRYSSLLPRPRNKITLGEGCTPLIRMGRDLLLKFEGANPTGSFKDRGMTVGVSIAKEAGASSLVVASTGNTAASAAAYGAAAGLEVKVALPDGHVAMGKLAQAIIHGATILKVRGGFDEALNYVLAREVGRSYPLNSFNPWRLEGQKTIALEVIEEAKVDNIIVPVGNAGNIYAIWKGYVEAMEAGLTDSIPRLIGVQAEGASPIASAWIMGREEPIPVIPETVASAIRIGKPVNWFRAWRAVKAAGGEFITVSDEEIINAQKALAKMGIFVELASASTYAAYLRLASDLSGSTVLIATGHGLKDPDAAAKYEMHIIEV